MIIFFYNNNRAKERIIRVDSIGIWFYNQNIITINDISILFQNKELVPKTFLTSSPEIISTSILKGKIVIIIDNRICFNEI